MNAHSPDPLVAHRLFEFTSQYVAETLKACFAASFVRVALTQFEMAADLTA